jgi:hypothetical protein
MDIVRQCSHSRGEPLRVVRQLALCSAIHCHPAVVDVLRPWAHRGYVYGLKPNASDSADKRRSIRTTYSYPACAIPVATNASAVARTSASVTPHLQSVPATLQCQQHLKRCCRQRARREETAVAPEMVPAVPTELHAWHGPCGECAVISGSHSLTRQGRAAAGGAGNCTHSHDHACTADGCGPQQDCLPVVSKSRSGGRGRQVLSTAAPAAPAALPSSSCSFWRGPPSSCQD